ncbi:MAG: hypothetical protein ACFFD2_12800 [Promethearchaeota archaeon]
MSEYDWLFKIIVVGNAEDLIERIMRPIKLFKDHYKYTIGLDFGIESVEVEGYKIKLQVWNLSNQQRFNNVRPLYFKGVAGILLITDQNQFLNIGSYIREFMNFCSPVPINLVVCCTPLFAKNLLNQYDRLRDIGYTLPLFHLDHPCDSYITLTKHIISRNLDGNEWLCLTLLPDNAFQWILINEQQNDTATFIHFLEEQMILLRHWTVPSRSSYNLYTNNICPLIKDQLNFFHETIEALGAKIDKTYNFATVINHIGKFKINLHNGSVNFIPLLCLICKNKCKSISKSLCIVQDSYGWSNFCLPKSQLLILAKIYAIQTKTLPKHVWNQIKQKVICYNKNITPFTQSQAHNRPRPSLNNTSTLDDLRDTMLQELNRLKEVTRGE